MTFDCIPASHRTSMLTVYNLGYAIVSVAGSLVGGLLLKLGGETYTAYLVVFAVSAAGRLLTLPLLAALPHKISEGDSADRASDTDLLDHGISVALQGTSHPPAAQPAVALPVEYRGRAEFARVRNRLNSLHGSTKLSMQFEIA